ncbi:MULTISPECIES: DUF4198 domain-containing protein [unclassified Delftia]|uniref:DUF4198 domain-containing protein n=1 Tax=unclassified Delftia TaxID=2613839 RepID=UPI001153DDC0|nr:MULTISPECIES: DUF4198 domain-containing protein [unclassified Delftia]MCB4785333.1 hypothetical protein [Delftia sp. Lp-1]TQL70889.1 hypothetical protein FB549_4921 [Delftia sp. HK171]
MTEPSRILRSTAAAWLAAAAALAVPAAHADYLWLQQDAGQARAYAGELRKPLEQLPALEDAKQVLPDRKSLPLKADANHFTADAGQGDVRIAATRPGANGVLTYYQARFGRNDTKAVNDLELVPTTAGGDTFQLVFKGRKVAASQVNVQTSEGWYRTLTPSQDGTVSFKPYFPGLYVLEVTARVDNGSVTLDGKKYTDVRHTTTLSFEVKP